MRVRIVGLLMPGRECGDYRHVHVGVQRGKQPEQLQPGDAEQAVFNFEVTPMATATGWDFKGPYVQGKRGERFIYLTWGELPPGGEYAMFRRAKLYLSDVDPGLLDDDVCGELPMTDRAGMPVCASVRPPVIHWTRA